MISCCWKFGASVENSRSADRRQQARRADPLMGRLRAHRPNEIDVPGVTDQNAYALEITGDSMLPVYREGDTIIVSPAATIRKGDRVVVRTVDGQVMAKLMQRQTSKTLELASFNPSHATKVLDMKDVDWIARILWASQ
jgi:phage repressor protein C with HTH and peptisase S24 domain